LFLFLFFVFVVVVVVAVVDHLAKLVRVFTIICMPPQSRSHAIDEDMQTLHAARCPNRLLT
jgi:hypothetical protein